MSRSGRGQPKQPYIGSSAYVPGQKAAYFLGLYTTTINTDLLPYAQTVLADSPIGYWQLQETSGTNATDVSSNALTGTYSGTYTQAVSGPFGTQTGVDFNGGKITIGDNAAMHLTGDMSLESWLKPADLSGFKAICSRTNGTYAGPWDSYTDNQSIQFYRGDTTSSGFCNLAQLPPLTTSWQHIVFTMAGTSATVYKNGVWCGQNFSLTCNKVDNAGNTLIGNRADNLGGHISLAHVALYNYALSATQISAHYAAAS